MKILTFAFCLISISINAQSLSPERVAKIKAITVRITIDSSSSTGTGFFINSDGQGIPPTEHTHMMLLKYLILPQAVVFTVVFIACSFFQL